MIDIEQYKDSQSLREDESLINILLKDYTTNKNIKWGTDSYKEYGSGFYNNQEITQELITGWYDGFVRPRAEKDIIIQQNRQRNKAEVFTPSWVIKLQVETVLNEMKTLTLEEFINTKWLEITCGEAPYMANRYDMSNGEMIPLEERTGFIDIKFNRINEENLTDKEWESLAIKIYQSSYGYEYQGDSLLLARENLLLTFIDYYFYKFGKFPDEKLTLKISKIISRNVFQMNGLTYEIPYSVDIIEENGVQLNLFEEIEVKEKEVPKYAKIKLWDENKNIKLKDIEEGNYSDMKFDVVIGNPPYQLERVGTRDKQIYPYFMDSSYRIGTKSILITPARFLFNAGDTPKAWNEKMLSDDHLTVKYYESFSAKVFKNTDIKGGVTVTYRDRNKKFGAIKTFIPIKELKSINDKVWLNNNVSSLSSIAYSAASYRLSKKMHSDNPDAKKILSKGNENQIVNNIFNKLPDIFFDSKPNDDKNYIQILGRLPHKGRIYKWILNNYVGTPNNFNKYKVFLPASNGSGNLGERLSSPIIAKPGTGHTQTFMSFGSFETFFESESLLKYLKTKFVRTLLSILKVTQHNPVGIWSIVPIQDFTTDSDIDWTNSVVEIDQQLYRKYNLNEEEIEFIENNVKEME